MLKLVRVFFAGALLIVAVSKADDFDARYQAIVASKGKSSESDRLRELFEADWAYEMAVSPESATYFGFPGYEDKWTDNSQAAIAERKTFAPRPLTILATIDRSRLSSADQISYDLFKRQGEEKIEGLAYPLQLLQITQLAGLQQDAAQVLSAMSTATAADYERELARLRALPAAITQATALLEEGMKRGVTPPQITLRDVPAQVLNQVPDDPMKSALLAGFVELPSTISGEDALRLRAEASRLYSAALKPAYLELHRFLTEQYIPAARATIGLSNMPNGAAWYAWSTKVQTSTDLTAKQIHELGLSEVKRIRAEMERIKALTGFNGSMEDFFTHLRTDPKFYYTDANELLRAYRDIAKRIDPQLMKLFRTLPRTTYGVSPVPSYAEKSQTTAYYNPGAASTGRPGVFFANTYALNTRPKWEMEPLTLHESVPGHHLQISLAQEMGELPAFRRFGGYTAFVEGWGLYAESLGDELGFYTDPYAKFGQLTYEMWRAVRLVVDTGMHAFGWTRQQAIDYFKANAGKNEHDIVVEIDRYIVMPAQALAYKLGELKIKELRAFATKELGPKFDVRVFHDEVLKNGAVPLSVLDSQVRAWVAQQKKL
ncbi:MAG: DUF885 domain-containing protein [Opitutus sp.]